MSCYLVVSQTCVAFLFNGACCYYNPFCVLLCLSILFSAAAFDVFGDKVCMLGRGRPFILEVINPRVVPFHHLLSDTTSTVVHGEGVEGGGGSGLSHCNVNGLYQLLPKLQEKVNALSGLNQHGDVQVTRHLTHMSFLYIHINTHSQPPFLFSTHETF